MGSIQLVFLEREMFGLSSVTISLIKLASILKTGWSCWSPCYPEVNGVVHQFLNIICFSSSFPNIAFVPVPLEQFSSEPK